MTLSMEAASIQELSEAVVKSCDEELLPVAVMYGANSSGKSNVLKALKAMRDVLLNSVKLFAVIENLEECVFAVTGEDGSLLEEIVYDRAELTKWIGVDSLWQDLDGEDLQAWLKDLHQRVIISLYWVLD